MKKIIYMFFIIISFFSVYSYGTENLENITDLKELRINHQGLTPNFDKNISKYYLNIPLKVDNIEITAIPENENSVIEIIGNTNLDEGVNLIVIRVNSEDEIQTKTYTIEVTKTENLEFANTNLENLAIQNILLNPPFDTNITKYNIEVSNDITDLNILAIPQNENAVIEINGGNDLSEGENKIEITVIGQNGISKKIYEINVYRQNKEETYKNEQAKMIQKEKLDNLYSAQKTNIKTNPKPEEYNLNKVIFLCTIFIILITFFSYILKNNMI